MPELTPPESSAKFWIDLLEAELPPPDADNSGENLSPPERRRRALLLAISEGRDCEILGIAESTIQHDSTESNNVFIDHILNKSKSVLNRQSQKIANGLDPHTLTRINEIIEKYPWLETGEAFQFWQDSPYLFDGRKSRNPLFFEHLRLENDSLNVLVVDRWKYDWSQIGKPSQTAPLLLLAPTLSIHLSLLSDPGYYDILITAHVYLWVGDAYPAQAFKSQDLGKFKGFEKRFHYSPSAIPYHKNSSALETAIDISLQQDVSGESEAFNALYRLNQDIARVGMDHRLGPAFSPEISRYFQNRSWMDSHKGKAYELERHPSPDSFRRRLSNLTPISIKRSGNRKRRIAHIVSQLVSQGHAPTKLISSLCTLSDKKKFETHLFCVEGLATRPASYPQSLYNSPPTSDRGKDVLIKLQDQGIANHIFEPGSNTLEESAWQVVSKIQEIQLDAIICHGDDPLLYLISNLCTDLLKVHVEHSSLPSYAGYDLAICNIAGSAAKWQSSFEKWNTKLVDNPYGVDCRADWPDDPPNLGLPEGAKAITTISNHLEARLSDEFLKSVAAILTINPETVYLPIGHVDDQAAMKDRFAPYGVQDRVAFLGARPNPSHLCRAMYLYLNEFPFGGGLSIMDGMSAGLPVVSMFDEKGPMQAQNAGNYIGRDHCIQDGDTAKYVALASEILQQRETWEAWSNHSLAEYDKRGPEPYTRRFEAILEEALKEGH